MFGGKLKELFTFAWAIEMIHSCLFNRDDLPALDDDDVGRGAPKAH
jgi:geranylgeranyl pyrophosphate synthase